MKSLKQLNIDYVRQNPIWEDLLDVIDAVNTEQVILPTQALEDIRNISRDTDPNIIDRSIRQLGFRLLNDILQLNKDKLHKVFYHLSLHHEINGTPLYPKFIQFLLGRGFSVYSTYTADFISFFAEPKGDLVHEGGIWYKTSHVDLSAEQEGLAEFLDLQPVSEDVSYLTPLVADQKGLSTEEAETQVRAFITDTSWQSHEDYPMYETFLLEKRVMDLFYTYAPVEEVVRAVYFSVIHEIKGYLTASSAIQSKEYQELGSSAIAHIHLITSTYVTANQEYDLQLQVVYEDGTQDTLLPDTVEFEQLGQYAEGKATYTEPMYMTEVEVVATKRDMKAHLTLFVYPLGVPMVPSKVYIRGPSNTMENTSATYVLYGEYGAESRPVDDHDSVVWSINNDKCTIENGIVEVGELFAEETLQVKAYYEVDTEVFDTNLGVRLINGNNIFRPTAINCLFEGLNSTDVQMTQGHSYNVMSQVTYSDNTVKTVFPEYALKSNSATISPQEVISSSIVDRDFSCILEVVYTEDGYRVSNEYEISFNYPRTKVGKFEIISADTITEGTTVYLTARVFWVLEEATDEQIENEDADIAIGWAQVYPNWTSYKSNSSIITTVDVDDDGRFVAPLVDQDTQTIIAANIQTENGVITTSKTITIIDQLLEVTFVDMIVNTTLLENDVNAITCEALWNTGKRTDIDADLSFQYFPSQSTIDREEAKVLEELGDDVDLDDYLEENPIDYDSLITLELQDVDYTFVDKVKDPDTEVNRKGLYFVGDNGGTVLISAKYTNVVTGVEHEQTTKLSLSPNINQAQSIEIEILGTDINDTMFVDEASRALVRAKVTYADGSTSYENPQWSLEPMLIDDEYPLIDITSATFTGTSLISVLSGTTVNDVEGFMALPEEIRNLDEFSGVPQTDPELKEYLDSTLYNRTIFVTRYVDEDTLIEAKAIYYNLEDYTEFYIQNAAITPTETIVASRLEGPVTILASYEAASYVMYNTYFAADNSPDTWEFAVSNAWSLEDIVVFADDGTTPLETDLIPFEIDQDGYLRPRENVSAEATVVATFDDGIQTVVRTMEIRMEKSNIELERLIVNGPATVYDTVSRNQDEGITIGYDDSSGRFWYIPYSCGLVRVSDSETVEPLTFLEWSLEGVSEEGITISDTDGKLFISKELPSDDQIVLVAEYSEELVDGTIETVKTRYEVNVASGRAIDDLVIEDPGTLAPNTDIQLEATYTRRNGLNYSTSLPEPDVDVSWTFLSASSQDPDVTPEGIKLTAQGVLNVPASEAATFVQARVTVIEGNTELSESFEFTVRGEGYPEAITVSGYSDIRDDSQIQYAVTLDRRERPSEDVTSSCLWSIRDNSDRELYLPNVEVDTLTGILTVGELSHDTTFYVYALYVEGSYQLSHSIEVTARSSYPVQGVAEAGINTIEELDQYILDKLASSSGGSFVLNAASTQYGYFAHRKDYGLAKLSAIDNGEGYVNQEYGGWDGASWPSNSDTGVDGPIEVTRTYENTEDTWYVYRTNNRGFQIAGFAFYYESE